LGSFRWLINLWFILLTPSTFYFTSDLPSRTTKRGATCFIRVLFRITGIARVDGVIPSTDPIFASVYELCLATCFIHEHSACRSCEARIYSIQTEYVQGWTLSMQRLSIVNGNVCGRFHECWHERFVVFCDLLQVH
jgi:hypothetical protein